MTSAKGRARGPTYDYIQEILSIKDSYLFEIMQIIKYHYKKNVGESSVWYPLQNMVREETVKKYEKKDEVTNMMKVYYHIIHPFKLSGAKKKELTGSVNKIEKFIKDKNKIHTSRLKK